MVKAALGLDISKEDLGGAQVHTERNGVVDNVARDEKDALSQIRAFLSYLPSSVWEMPPRAEPAEPAVAAERLRTVVPESQRQPFDVYRILGAALDQDSFFEIAPAYGRSRVTGLGRGLSQGLERWRAPRAVHDPGKIIGDLAAAVREGKRS